MPTTNPTSLVPELIDPEGMMVIEAYLDNNFDINKTAIALGQDKQDIVKIYNRPEVKTYLSTIFNESGFRNRNKLFGLLDKLINMKLEEMDDTGLGSSMDIMDMLKTAHRMKMDEMKMEAELLKAKNAASGNNVTNQTNIQINDANYNTLMQSLLTKRV